MFSSAWIPFFITCIVYFLLGWGNATSSGSSDMSNILSESYDLSWPMVIPALLVVLLSLKKIEVRITLFISIICGMALAVIYQDVTIAELGQQIVWGFHPENEALARVMSGGGILSMMLVFGVVMISSSYAGIFQGTGFFEPLKKIRSYLERKGTGITIKFPKMSGKMLMAEKLIFCHFLLLNKKEKSIRITNNNSNYLSWEACDILWLLDSAI